METMESNGSMEWRSFLNKNIKVIYDDGNSFPSKKEGKLISSNSTHLIMHIGSSVQAILTSRVIRLEEMK